MKPAPPRILDVLIILLAIVLCAVLFMQPSSQGGLVKVTCDEGTFLYPLGDERTLTVSGPVGRTTIEIHDGHASIVDSDCPNGTCMHSSISRYPQTVVCLNSKYPPWDRPPQQDSSPPSKITPNTTPLPFHLREPR